MMKVKTRIPVKPAHQSEKQPEKPRLFKVVIWNDDNVSGEIVVEILQKVFGKTHTDAYRLAMAIHNKLNGVAGVYTKDIAETKAEAATKLGAKLAQEWAPFMSGVSFPPGITVEPED